MACDEMDLIIQQIVVEALGRPGEMNSLRQSVDLFLKAHEDFPEKPTALVLGTSDTTEEWRWHDLMGIVNLCTAAGVPVYSHIDRAARALSNLCQYHEFLASRKVE